MNWGIPGPNTGTLLGCFVDLSSQAGLQKLEDDSAGSRQKAPTRRGRKCSVSPGEDTLSPR